VTLENNCPLLFISRTVLLSAHEFKKSHAFCKSTQTIAPDFKSETHPCPSQYVPRPPSFRSSFPHLRDTAQHCTHVYIPYISLPCTATSKTVINRRLIAFHLPSTPLCIAVVTSTSHISSFCHTALPLPPPQTTPDRYPITRPMQLPDREDRRHVMLRMLWILVRPTGLSNTHH
jgi:hypothetical protein